MCTLVQLGIPKVLHYTETAAPGLIKINKVFQKTSVQLSHVDLTWFAGAWYYYTCTTIDDDVCETDLLLANTL